MYEEFCKMMEMETIQHLQHLSEPQSCTESSYLLPDTTSPNSGKV